MTTKVRVELVQKHIPVIIEILRKDGSISQTQTISEFGAAVEEYVHSGQSMRVREMTTEEQHNAGL